MRRPHFCAVGSIVVDKIAGFVLKQKCYQEKDHQGPQEERTVHHLPDLHVCYVATAGDLSSLTWFVSMTPPRWGAAALRGRMQGMDTLDRLGSDPCV